MSICSAAPLLLSSSRSGIAGIFSLGRLSISSSTNSKRSDGRSGSQLSSLLFALAACVASCWDVATKYNKFAVTQ